MHRWLGSLVLLLVLGVLPAGSQDAKRVASLPTCTADTLHNTLSRNYIDDTLLSRSERSIFRVQASDCSNVGQGGCGGYNSDTGQDCPCDMRPITSNCGGERTISCGYDDYCAKTNCHK